MRRPSTGESVGLPQQSRAGRIKAWSFIMPTQEMRRGSRTIEEKARTAGIYTGTRCPSASSQLALPRRRCASHTTDAERYGTPILSYISLMHAVLPGVWGRARAERHGLAGSFLKPCSSATARKRDNRHHAPVPFPFPFSPTSPTVVACRSSRLLILLQYFHPTTALPTWLGFLWH